MNGSRQPVPIVVKFALSQLQMTLMAYFKLNELELPLTVFSFEFSNTVS